MHVEDSDRETANVLLSEQGIKQGDSIFGISISKNSGNSVLIEKFAEIGDRLAEKYNCRILLIGSMNETSVAEQIAELMKIKPIILTGKTTLRQASAIIERCRLFIGVDGDFTHIAAAMGTPIVSIFGPTNWIQNAPYSEKSIVIKSDMQCSPCQKSYDDEPKCQTYECLSLIDADVIIESVEKLVR
jgi:heptosyltransferase II